MEKTLLLDLDGTLSDSFPGIRASFLYALDKMGITPPSDLSYIAGPPMVETLADLGLDSQQVATALNYYLEDQQHSWKKTSIFPGVLDLLQKWSGTYQLATATSKGEHFAKLALDYLGITPFIDVFGAAEEGPHARRKSKEQVIRHTLEIGSIDPQNALMIGDRIHDVEGARACGIDTVLVGWGYGTPHEHAQAQYFAQTPADLERIVHDWN